MIIHHDIRHEVMLDELRPCKNCGGHTTRVRWSVRRDPGDSENFVMSPVVICTRHSGAYYELHLALDRIVKHKAGHSAPPEDESEFVEGETDEFGKKIRKKRSRK